MVIDDSITGICVSYNGKEILQRAIESIRKFHPKMKLIIIDGSDISNPCYEYICDIADKYTKVFHAENNIGHGRGLCAGIEYVETPYILIFDSDIEMLNSPLEEMLAMFEKDTYGVGYNEIADLGGHEWGSRKDKMKEGPMPYLHPYFCLIQKKEYLKYEPFCHHGAPAVNTMLDIYRRGLSDKVIKEFHGLGHSSGKGWVWEGTPKEYIKHDTRGTRDIRVKNRLPEIEGRWDNVIDHGNKTISVITCTGDRPLAFSLCQKWIEQQTVKPNQWIIIDDGFIPMIKPDLPYVVYIRREPKPSDIKPTMILNIKQALKLLTGDKIIFMEDDEYYTSKYIEEMSKRLDQYEIVGIGRSKYYMIGSNSYHHHANMGHASLAQTAFTKAFMSDFLNVLEGNSFIDIRLWNIVNPGMVHLKETGKHEYISEDGRGYIFEDKEGLYVGMKGLPGRPGIGAGHKALGNIDIDKNILKEWVVKKEDFEIYNNLLPNDKPIVKPKVDNIKYAPMDRAVRR
jgi:glycosyltransferase involved in cell wall biosynthesis